MLIGKDWTKALSLDETLSILDGLALRHASLAGKTGSEIARLISAGDRSATCAFKLDLQDPSWDHSQLYHARQSIAFFKKLEDLDVGVDKNGVAWASFLAAERQNEDNNNVLRLFLGQTNQDSREPVCSVLPDFSRLFYAVKRKIEVTLGVAPKVSELRFKFGPGATTTVKRRDSCPSNKLAESPQCSANLLHSHHFSEFVRENPWLLHHAEGFSLTEDEELVGHFDFAVGSGRIVFAPKNAGTSRVIDTQPTLNGFFQAGVGKAIEGCLLRVGVDIHDQTKNQRLARGGSLFGHIATIDLRNASNTIYSMLVRTLIGPDWLDLLNAGRTPSTVYDGEVYDLSMFSAMGNGYTFPLETLIFWAITSVVCSDTEPRYIGVYGDDIICPAQKAQAVVNALRAFGFSINPDKSFMSGPFRESCGSDYYMGSDVRPFYQKHLVSGESLFVLHNFYYRRGLFLFAKEVVNLIPHGMRIYGPDGYGDGHLLSNRYPLTRYRKNRKYVTYVLNPCNIQWIPPTCLQEDWGHTRKTVRLGDGYAGGVFRTYSRTGKQQVTLHPGDICAPSYACEFNARVPVVAAAWLDPDTRVRTKLSLQCVTESSPVSYLDDGRPLWDVPGTDGYEVTEVYIFEDV